MSETMEDKKTEIQDMGLGKIKSYFELDADEIGNMNKEQLYHLHNMARLGMQFEKEMNLARRSTEMNFIRVGKLISDSKEELKKYLKKSLPKYT